VLTIASPTGKSGHTSTRCRRCKSVVRVPASARSTNGFGVTGSKGEHTFGVVLLSCGHPAAVVVHPGRSVAATLKRFEWECPDSGATVTARQVLAVVSEAEWENMTDEALDLLVSTAAS